MLSYGNTIEQVMVTQLAPLKRARNPELPHLVIRQWLPSDFEST